MRRYQGRVVLFWFGLVFLCVAYADVCVYTHTCTNIHAHMCTRMWRLTANLIIEVCLSFSPRHFILSLSLNLLLQGSSWLYTCVLPIPLPHLASTKVTDTHFATFAWMLAFTRRPVCLHNWAISLSANHTFPSDILCSPYPMHSFNTRTHTHTHTKMTDKELGDRNAYNTKKKVTASSHISRLTPGHQLWFTLPIASR